MIRSGFKTKQRTPLKRTPFMRRDNCYKTPPETSEIERRQPKRHKVKKANLIPLKLREELSNDPQYKICSLRDYAHLAGPCDGNITWEHAMIYAGSKIQEKWAIIPLCERHHAVNRYQDAGTLKKGLNHWIALNRASDFDIAVISKAENYAHRKAYYNTLYGVWKAPVIPKT